jgi:hypothetical protein
LFDQFLAETKSKFVYTVWGEREVRFKTNERRRNSLKLILIKKIRDLVRSLNMGRRRGTLKHSSLSTFFKLKIEN